MLPIQIRYFTTTTSNSAQLKKLIKKTTKYVASDSNFLKKLNKEANPAKINPNSKFFRSSKPQKLLVPEIPQITRQHAAHLLSKKLGVDVDMNTLGPLTNDDIKYFPIANKQIMLTLLGTTSNQLLDSVVVDKSVRSFLKRDQVEKALTMAKLAKEKGTVAMNRIMEYHLKAGKVHPALDIFHLRKKWGVPPNDQTYTVLFDGCAKVRTPDNKGLGSAQIAELKRILLLMKETESCTPNIYHMNSGLQCLLNTDDLKTGLELFNDWTNKNFTSGEEKWFSKIRPDTTTFSIVLKALPYCRNNEWIYITGEYIMQQIANFPESKKDAQLFESYIFAYLRSRNIEIVKKGFQALNHYFQFDKEVKAPYIKPSKSNKFNEPLPILKEFQEKETKLQPQNFKYFPSVALIDTILKTYNNYENYERTQKLFDEFAETYPKKIDLVLAQRYFQSIKGKDVFEETLKFYERLQTSLNLKPTNVTHFLVFEAIYSKSLHNLNDMGKYTIGYKAIEIFNDSENFVKVHLKDILDPLTMNGYLKSVRRLRLNSLQRDVILSRISKYKESHDFNNLQPKDHGFHKKILETEKVLIGTIEKKRHLHKMDEDAKPSKFLTKI